MSLRRRSFFLFLAVLVLLSGQYLFGVATVPFHPDETSYIFMSVDLKPLIFHPSSLFWQKNRDDGRQWYRLLNPSLLHYTIQVGRTVAGLPAIQDDWIWSLSWGVNEQNGRIPSPQLLLAARMAIASLFPLSLLLFYWFARKAFGETSAWVGFLLLGTNALILLHTRRAMAEGLLVFTLILALWSIIYIEKHPWLAAIPIGLAFCAKQSLIPLVGIGLLAILWQPGVKKNWGIIARQVLLYSVCFTLIVYLLNPAAWKQPVQTIQEAVRLRQYIVKIQVEGFPMYALKTPTEKLTSLLNQVYFAPLMFAEEQAHLPHIQAAVTAYQSNPLNMLFRSIVWGSLLLAFTVAGITASIYRLFHSNAMMQRRIALLLFATLLQVVILLVMIPLSWQRYYVPLIPYVCLWAGYGVFEIKELATRAVTKRIPPALPVS